MKKRYGRWKRHRRWTGVVIVAAGIFSLVIPFFYGYNSVANLALWTQDFYLFVGGIAAAIIGAVAYLGGQFYMKAAVAEYPVAERKPMEIPA